MSAYSVAAVFFAATAILLLLAPPVEQTANFVQVAYGLQQITKGCSDSYPPTINDVMRTLTSYTSYNGGQGWHLDAFVAHSVFIYSDDISVTGLDMLASYNRTYLLGNNTEYVNTGFVRIKLDALSVQRNATTLTVSVQGMRFTLNLTDSRFTGHVDNTFVGSFLISLRCATH